ncbi:holo-ACP synthase [Phosphitispora sp. TUW77]|uniref:holo-ACP synthase n=1 Tax=Phosphitispora sp. TUW77 TaxID=3152361 RepID=UPI003AB385EF
MIKGTGVDIIEISRIKNAFRASEKFGSRIFTANEQDYCMAKKYPWPSLAARFAAKEALAKAMGTGIGRVSWTDIEIVKNDWGRPEAILSGAALEMAKRLCINSFEISLSHCKEYAVAFVVAHAGFSGTGKRVTEVNYQ